MMGKRWSYNVSTEIANWRQELLGSRMFPVALALPPEEVGTKRLAVNR
jgi:hypothetical protein